MLKTNIVLMRRGLNDVHHQPTSNVLQGELIKIHELMNKLMITKHINII